MRELMPLTIGELGIPVHQCGVLVIGSGAAALAAAERLAAAAGLANGTIASDTVIATESLAGGTSFNTGSDKQTYYRLSLADRAGDSAWEMAEALWNGGAVHGDVALAEALGSIEAFCRLVSLGVPFPMNASGGFVGYKTDHDPRKRGTSIGPYTSKVMVERLLAEVHYRGVPILEGLHAVALVADPPAVGLDGIVVRNGRVYGALFVDGSRLDDESYGLRLIVADAVVFGVGGPGGLYGASVYPAVHHGAIGLAVEIGAPCVNLTESQFGLASIGFRWNVSGTYQQAVPRYVSVDADGNEEEFLSPFFPDAGARDSAVFLKGYQWPFDPRKVAGGGSSLVDLLVHRERVERGRRVYMDFTRNPAGWDPAGLSDEAREYLERSGALGGTPLDRLARMNPLAIEHYASHGIDLSADMLEVAVCAQHNNGGLAADAWWESTVVDRLFPVGEVNGSHGVYRPGGAALNAGQVGAARAARRIVGAYGQPELRDGDWRGAAAERAAGIVQTIRNALGNAAGTSSGTLASYRDEFRRRMDRHAGIVRPALEAQEAARAAIGQFGRFSELRIESRRDIPELLRCRHLALAHAAYLSAVASYVAAGGGSRGSSIVASQSGTDLHPAFDAAWRAIPERPGLLGYLEETRYADGVFAARWEARRPIPESDDWFENVWRSFREGKLFTERRDAWSRSS
jgi:succinate dehydrogenase/fumarate reductase flavoprotein subunit